MSEDGIPGSHAANQGKTESIPPTQGHGEPDAGPAPSEEGVPDLADMNVGAGDPQAPSHPAAGPAGDRDRAGVPVLDTPVLRAAAVDSAAGEDAGTSADVLAGPVGVGQGSEGTAQRVPGSLGTTGRDEQIETDVQRSVDSTSTSGAPNASSGPGDAGGVPVTSGDAAPGTSQDSAVVRGARTPE